MNGAIYDATIAAWDAKYTYNRPRPAVTDAELKTAIPTPNSPSYPDEHAVTARAAATVLAYLFPDDAEHFSELATEAADSRVMAGVAYPSDIAAGLELGGEVGKLFIEYAKTDGSNAEFDPATMPTGQGIWNGDPDTLAVPTLGTWETWVLESTRSIPSGAATGTRFPGASRRDRRGQELRARQRALHASYGSGRRTRPGAGAGLGSLLQQPSHLLLRPGAALPVGAGVGAEAVRVPVGYAIRPEPPAPMRW